MNIYHVMLGVAIGAGGVIVGMQIFTLAKKKRKKKNYTPKHRLTSPHDNTHIPSLFHSPGNSFLLHFSKGVKNLLFETSLLVSLLCHRFFLLNVRSTLIDRSEWTISLGYESQLYPDSFIRDTQSQ